MDSNPALGREKQEQRKKEFKKGIDSDEARKKREENSVSIRKAKREEGLSKKRNLSGFTDKKAVDSTVAQRVIIIYHISSLSLSFILFIFPLISYLNCSSKNFQI